MLAGKPPFRGKTEYLTFELINSGMIQFTEEFTEEASSFCLSLLKHDPKERMAADGNFAAIKQHPFLAGIDVDSIFQSPVPVIPPATIIPKRNMNEDSEEENPSQSPSKAPQIAFSNGWGPRVENIIKQGVILKRGGGVFGWRYLRRQLVLT